MTSLSFQPYVPLALWISLTIAGAVLLLVYGLRAWGRLPRARWAAVLLLMATAVIIPLVLLLNPTWIQQVPPPAGKPLLTIVVDTSASMQIADMEEAMTRQAMATRIARETAAKLSDRFELRVRRFAASSSIVELERLMHAPSDGASTDIAQALSESLEDRPQGQVVLLLSDGADNAPGGSDGVRQVAERARAMAAPIYVHTLGSNTSVNDLQVSLNLPQEIAFLEQDVAVVANVQQRGQVTNRARLSLLLEGEVTDQQDVDLSPDGVSQAIFRIRQDAVGLYRYEVRVDGYPNEVTDINNRAMLLLRIVDEPLHVLLLEGKPYWDTKFLVRTLAADRSIDLTSVVRLADSRFIERRIARPAGEQTDGTTDAGVENAAPEQAEAVEGEGEGDGESEREGEGEGDGEQQARQESWKAVDQPAGLLNLEALRQYQVVVLGRDADVYLDATVMPVIKQWLIKDGGCLVCFRGPPSSRISQRLGELMPIRWSPSSESRFRVQLTDSGQAMHWLPGSESEDPLAKLPSLAAVHEPESPKTLAVVLATTTDTAEQVDPVVTYQPVGNGRVVVVEGAGMWRWAFLPPEYQQYDEIYGTLWRSLIRWLVTNAGLLPSQQMALRSDKTSFNTSETATATLLLRDVSRQPPQVELTSEALNEPQLVAAVPSGLSPGQFRVAFGQLPEGHYLARVVGLDQQDPATVTAFDVRDNLRERLEVAARPDLMRMIAQRSGGLVLEDVDPDELSERFEEHLAVALPQRTLRIPAWDRLWVLAAVLGLWGICWGLRRSSGLV